MMKRLFTLLAVLAVPNTLHSVAADQPDCYTDVDDISIAEGAVLDVETPREYILCPNTDFVIGVSDSQTGEFIGGSFAMLVRKNTIIKCGADGKRENNCIVRDGTVGMLAIAGPFDNFDEFLDGIVVQGVTFQGLREVGMTAESWGHITMIDCAFVENFNIAPAILQYNGDPSGTTPFFRRALGDNDEEKNFDAAKFQYRTELPNSFREKIRAAKPTLDHKHIASHREPEANEENRDRKLQNPLTLTVDFVSCDFIGNGFAAPMLPGVVSILYDAAIVSFKGCNFIDNDYSDPTPQLSYMILIDDNADLTIEDTCFINNDVFGRGVVSAVTDIDSVTVLNNYGTEEDDVTCQFVALRPSQSGTDVCIDYDATECASTAEAPSSAPTDVPVVPKDPPTAPPTAPPTTSGVSGTGVMLGATATISSLLAITMTFV